MYKSKDIYLRLSVDGILLLQGPARYYNFFDPPFM